LRILSHLGLILLTVFSVDAAIGQQRAPASDGRAGAKRESAEQMPVLQQRFPRYRVRAGDVLEVNFTFSSEFNQTVTVQPDGYVTIRGLGDLRIQDKTVPEVVEAMRTAYGKILHDPEITVELKDFEKPYFIVSGEVARPGKYDLRGETTILQAVAVAGDFKSQSKSSQVLLFRRVSDDWAEVREVDIKQMLRSKNLTEDLHLRPGDMVFVPKNPWSRLERFIPVPSLGMFFNPLGF